jgi:thiol-disulfide isomerase/thioredoxin
MPVTRISRESLDEILTGRVNQDATCVVKFYSNDCHMCHSLHDYYNQISDIEKYNDLHFLAFNIQDDPNIEKDLNFKGVPTIFIIHSHIGNRPATLRLLEDPEDPNEKTWYKVNDIKKFIDREAL